MISAKYAGLLQHMHGFCKHMHDFFKTYAWFLKNMRGFCKKMHGFHKKICMNSAKVCMISTNIWSCALVVPLAQCGQPSHKCNRAELRTNGAPPYVYCVYYVLCCMIIIVFLSYVFIQVTFLKSFLRFIMFYVVLLCSMSFTIF